MNTQELTRLTVKDLNKLSPQERIAYLDSLKQQLLSLEFDEKENEKQEKTYKFVAKNIVIPWLNMYHKPEVNNAHLIPDEDGFGVICNHLGSYDQFYQAVALGEDKAVHFLQASTLLTLKDPRGFVYRKMAAVTVDRGIALHINPGQDRAMQLLLHRKNVNWYAEGTRRAKYVKDSEQLKTVARFKLGAAFAAVLTGAKFVPMAVTNARRDEGPVFVNVGKPISASPSDNVFEVNAEMQSSVQTLLDENVSHGAKIYSRYNPKKNK